MENKEQWEELAKKRIDVNEQLLTRLDLEETFPVEEDRKVAEFVITYFSGKNISKLIDFAKALRKYAKLYADCFGQCSVFEYKVPQSYETIYTRYGEIEEQAKYLYLRTLEKVLEERHGSAFEKPKQNAGNANKSDKPLDDEQGFLDRCVLFLKGK